MKQYSALTYSITGIITVQSVLVDLTNRLNEKAKEGWKVINVQLIGQTDFLIIIEK